MRRVPAFMFLVLLLVPFPSTATTVRYLDLDSLVGSSSLVFHATVTQVQASNQGTLKSPRIVTDVTFTVHRVLKGTNPGPAYTLRLVGGSVDGYTLAIPGQPRFRTGEEVVVFLEFTGIEHVVTGMSQGVFRVAKDANDRPIAVRDLTGLSLVRPGGAPDQFEPGRPEEPLLLEELFRRVNESRAR